ncbi:hypothetical protein HDE_02101 [Halotydeus destructor]|nr:hypothetical protein HDE_02101 [Halotydeus destructor]
MNLFCLNLILLFGINLCGSHFTSAPFFPPIKEDEPLPDLPEPDFRICDPEGKCGQTFFFKNSSTTTETPFLVDVDDILDDSEDQEATTTTTVKPTTTKMKSPPIRQQPGAQNAPVIEKAPLTTSTTLAPSVPQPAMSMDELLKRLAGIQMTTSTTQNPLAEILAMLTKGQAKQNDNSVEHQMAQLAGGDPVVARFLSQMKSGGNNQMNSPGMGAMTPQQQQLLMAQQAMRMNPMMGMGYGGGYGYYQRPGMMNPMMGRPNSMMMPNGMMYKPGGQPMVKPQVKPQAQVAPPTTTTSTTTPAPQVEVQAGPQPQMAPSSQEEEKEDLAPDESLTQSPDAMEAEEYRQKLLEVATSDEEETPAPSLETSEFLEQIINREKDELKKPRRWRKPVLLVKASIKRLTLEKLRRAKWLRDPAPEYCAQSIIVHDECDRNRKQKLERRWSYSIDEGTCFLYEDPCPGERRNSFKQLSNCISSCWRQYD